MVLTRRDILSAAFLPLAAPILAAQERKRLKIACVTTIFRRHSHSQHFSDRFLEGYGWNGAHHRPAMDLVSLYVDQVGENDLSRERAKRFPSLTIYPSIAEALTLGGNQLAVDGVLLIGEHGEYPRNEKGQRLYPRYEFFREITKVFQSSGRSTPIFNDKHFSWNWEWATEMYDTAKRMGFPLMAGSSLPVTWRIPSIDLPLGARVQEAMCVTFGGVDSYDFHGFETIQCMVERRHGGETGVKWIETYRGERFWEAYRNKVWPRDLMEAALARSHTLMPSRKGFNDDFPTLESMQRMVEDPVAYRYEHNDGLRCTLLLMHGLVRDFNFAARLEGRTDPLSTQMYLSNTMEPNILRNYFSPLVHHVEEMFLTGKTPYPIERTLLTTGLTAAGVESLHRDQTRYDTPHLKIAYQPARESTFWRS